MVQTDKGARTSRGHSNPSPSLLSDLYKSNGCQLERPRWRQKEEEREGRRKKQGSGEREGRDGPNKRGKDKESCTSMKHERRKGNGWVVLFPSFEVFVESFFFFWVLIMLPSSHCSEISPNLLVPEGVRTQLCCYLVIVLGFSWTSIRNLSTPRKSCLRGKSSAS